MKHAFWKIPDEAAAAPQALLDAGYSPLLAALLSARGLGDPTAARDFLYSGAESLSDPMAMADMPAAVARLRQAIARKEHVAVYGDYDVDGITAACLLTDWLRSKGVETELYIPDRIEEGYGLNTAAIQALHARGVGLLVTVDCGVTALEEARAAADLGMDMIITDHHECKETLPRCIAVVDPKRPDCPGCKSLAGVGVAFKLVCAAEGDSAGPLTRFCDLVTVGTIADVMPLVDENRYILREGLKKLARCPRPGLAALLSEAGMGEKQPSAMTVGFTLAPRLNAAGRLGRASLATELLLCRDPGHCTTLAQELCALNRERQSLEQAIWQDAAAMLEAAPPDGPIVLAKEGWHQGVIGIAASRLTEAFSRPAIMICLDGDKGKGSCRSFGGFNLFEALSACGDTLEGFGGHAQAAGLTIRRENIPAFRAAMARYYRENPPQGGSAMELDLCIGDARLLDMDCVSALEELEPFGCGNPRPAMCFTGAILESMTPIGGGKHLRLRLQKFGRSWNCVFFSQTAETLGVKPGMRVDAAFFPQINQFHDRCSVQLLLLDLRPAEYMPLCRALLSGALPPAREREAVTPQREDFVRLWRRLEALGGRVSGPLADTLQLISGARHPGLICVCLLVFAESGLVRLHFQDDRLEAQTVKTAAKADLEAASLMRRLRRS